MFIIVHIYKNQNLSKLELIFQEPVGKKIMHNKISIIYGYQAYKWIMGSKNLLCDRAKTKNRHDKWDSHA